MLLIRFDAELNAARDETSQERIAKEQLSREKATMKSDMDMLQQEMNVSCVHTHTHAHARMHAHAHTRRHTHTHADIHTHTRTHTHRLCILIQLLKSENQQIKRERDELEEANMASSDSVSEVSIYLYATV